MAAPQKIEFTVGEVHKVLIHLIDLKTFLPTDGDIGPERDANCAEPEPLKDLQRDPLTATYIEHSVTAADQAVSVQTLNGGSANGRMRLRGYFRVDVILAIIEEAIKS